MTVSKVLSQAAVARMLGVSRKTVREWTNTGRLVPWFRDDNGRPVYTEETIAADQRRAGEVAAERRAS